MSSEEHEVDELFGPEPMEPEDVDGDQGAEPVAPPKQRARAEDPKWRRSAIRYGRITLGALFAGFVLFMMLAPFTCSGFQRVDTKVQQRKELDPPGEPSNANYEKIYPRRPRQVEGAVADAEIESAFEGFGRDTGEASEDPWREREEPTPPSLREKLYDEGLMAPTRVASLGASGGAEPVAGVTPEGRSGAIESAFARVERAAQRFGERDGGSPSSRADEGTPNARRAHVETATLPAGTTIQARLVTEINSDLPGTVMARVDRDVRSADYEEVLIPAGAMLIADYESDLEVGQNALFVGWHTVVYPNGVSWDLQGLPSHRLSGASGLRDRVNHHTWPIFGQAALLGLVSASFDVGRVESGIDTRLGSGERAGNAVVTEMERAAGKLLDRAVDRAPTVKIRRGQAFYVLVTRATEFPSW